MNSKRGGTLVEVVAAVIILGAIAALAIPQYGVMADRAKAAELVSITNALGKAHRAFFYEYGGWTGAVLGAGTPEDEVQEAIGVTIPQADPNDSYWTAYVGRFCIGSPTGTVWGLASIYHNRPGVDRDFQIIYDEDGKIWCQSCTTNYCRRLGFENIL